MTSSAHLRFATPSGSKNNDIMMNYLFAENSLFERYDERDASREKLDVRMGPFLLLEHCQVNAWIVRNLDVNAKW